jgi:hypothetical protein
MEVYDVRKNILLPAYFWGLKVVLSFKKCLFSDPDVGFKVPTTKYFISVRRNYEEMFSSLVVLKT